MDTSKKTAREIAERGRRDKSKRLTVALTAALVIAAGGSYAAVSAWGAGTDAQTAEAVIKDADGTTYTMPLDRDATKTVTSSAGTNIIEVASGKVRVSEADCPNLDCVHQGWIEKTGQQIVCLPHKLTVDIADDATAVDYDIVGR